MPLKLKAQRYSLEEINRNILECSGNERLFRFRNDISVIVYRYPRYRYGLNDDFCSEFYLFFYRTMNRIIVSYRDSGSTFAAYLFSTLRWQLSKFLKMKKHKAEEFEFAKNFAILEDKLYTSPSEPLDFGRDKLSLNRVVDGRKKAVFSNRILLYLFRFWYRFSDENISKISESLGYDKEWLAEKLGRVQKRMQRKLDRKRRIEERRNVVFYELSKAYKKLEELKVEEAGYTGSLEREEMERIKRKVLNKISKLKRIMNNAVVELSNLKLSPSHRVLSEILGIPKGTIDTSNYMLEKDMDKYIEFWENL